MAHGDDALDAGMDILTGNEDRRDGWDEINKTRDYIAQRTSAVTPISKGGTGAENAAAARANLGIDLASPDTTGLGGDVPTYTGAGQLTANAPSADWHVTNRAAVRNMIAAGGTITGQVYLPNSTAAVSSYTVAYINGDGRISRGASSERYKHAIHEIDPDMIGDVFPALHEFILDGDATETIRYGFIAERLAEHPDQAQFVVYDEQGRPDSIDFISLLMVQNAQLLEAYRRLEARLDDVDEDRT